MINLRNKKVLITGATGGIGGSLVKKFLSLNAEVLGTGTKSDKLEKLKNIFDKFPGNSPVEIFYKYNGLQANISINGITVDNSTEFQEEIKDAIG